MLNKVVELGKRGMEKVSGVYRAVALCACALVTGVVMSGSAMAADTIPAMPVDFAALATEATTIVGTVLGAVAGIIIIIALVRMGFRFLTRTFTGNV